MLIKTSELETQNVIHLQATPRTPTNSSRSFTPLVERRLTEKQLDEKLNEFKGKKDKKEDRLFDSGKLMEDEEKEIINVDYGTIKRIVSMSGGLIVFAVIVFAQCTAEFFEA